jgi:type IV secretion system protein VirD4
VTIFIILILLLAALGVAVYRVRHHAHLARNRERHLRMRLHLRRRPGRGHATGFQLWWSFGRWASYRKSGQTRPSLSKRTRRRYPDEHSVWLGRAHHRRGLRLPVQEHALIFAPPRTGKTQLLSRLMVHYPGPALVTSTKADVYRDTSGLRLLAGPIATLNPQCIGGIASTAQWSPVEGCQDQAVAIRRADGFANAVHGTGGDKENALFRNAARAYLRAMFHAAALTGGDMRLVARWALTATKGGAREAEAILQANGAGDWADELAQLHGAADRTNATNEMVMTQVMGFMANPQLAVAALPGPGAIDLPRFLSDCGTLYLIADPEGNDESPLSPYFAALAGEVRYVASMIGQASASRRLDPPLGMFLDEATQICRCPIPSWLADSGGKGIQIFTVVHGEAQLAEAWGAYGRRIIMDTSGCKVALPGIDDPDTLDMLSRICGEHSYRIHGQDGWHQHARMTPSMINQLPDGFALIKRGNIPPVVAKLAAVRKDRRVRRARRQGWITAPVQGAAGALPELYEPDLRGELQLEPVARLRAPADREPAMSGGREMADVLPAPAGSQRKAYPWEARRG